MSTPTRFAAAFSLFALTSCYGDFAHDETLVGRYRLVAVDTDEDMSICWSLHDDGCVGDGLPGPTVFAAGFNNKYVVAAVHLKNIPAPQNRKPTQFYYVIRAFEHADREAGLPYGGIKGPFNQKEYESEKMRLHLPDFTRHFQNLM